MKSRKPRLKIDSDRYLVNEGKPWKVHTPRIDINSGRAWIVNEKGHVVFTFSWPDATSANGHPDNIKHAKEFFAKYFPEVK